MSSPKTEPGAGRAARTLAATIAGVVTIGAMLAGCSGLYFDRRETIALSSGDAIAANVALQTANPMPRSSEDTNIAANGQRMQSAMERYRTNKVTQPADTMTLQVLNQQAAPPTSTQTGYSGGAPQTAPVSPTASGQ